jgi:hypothetical protein
MHWQTAMKNTKVAKSIALAALAWGTASVGPSQVPGTLQVDRIEAHIKQVTVNPDDPNDRIVSVVVTIQAGIKPLVVPNCADEAAKEKYFCSAQLARVNGQSIRVRKGLMATLGVESLDKWKPVTIVPKTEEEFLFNFSTGLMDVRPGESLRVKFQAWPNVQSIQDWKSASTQLSPIFRCPSKPS